jgi:membrane protein YdbS with pleckstrin-like domain
VSNAPLDPSHSDQSTSPPDVRLFGDTGMPWRPVSPRLATARLLVLGVLVVPLLLVLLGLAAFVWKGFWVGVVAAALALAFGSWLIRRQVPAITWAEGAEELVVRRGRMFRTMVSVPYGRLQFVDVQSGPLERRFDMATVELHTASPQSGGQIPGLPTAEAEALRERLAARGESQRAGL